MDRKVTQVPPSQRARIELAFAALVVLVIVAAAVPCARWLLDEPPIDSRYQPGVVVDLDGHDGTQRAFLPPSIDPGPRLRVAIAPVISPERSLEVYQPFVVWLAHRLGRVPVFLRRQSYAEVNDLVRFDRCDLALVCTYSFVRGEREFGMRAIAIPQIRGKTTYNSVVIVPPGRGWQSLIDLRGRRFASADVMSTTGWLYPVTWLLRHGERAEDFFGHQLIAGSHDRALMAVASGLAEGAAVDSVVYESMIAETPDLADRLEVIDRSEPFGMPPLVVPAGLDAALAASLQREVLRMHEDPEGARILASLEIDRFVEPTPEAYDGVRELASAWERDR